MVLDHGIPSLTSIFALDFGGFWAPQIGVSRGLEAQRPYRGRHRPQEGQGRQSLGSNDLRNGIRTLLSPHLACLSRLKAERPPHFT